MDNKKSFVKGIALGIILMIVFNSVNFSANIFNTSKKEVINNKITEIMTSLDKNYVNQIDENKLVEGIYKGLVDAVDDPYTTYFDKQTLERFNTETTGKYAGIGVVVVIDPEDKLLTVISPFEGSPAAKAGILPEDKIMKVNGKDIISDKYEEAVAMIKGKEGTDVTITIYRKNQNKTFDVTVKRENINIPTVKHEMLKNNIGYLKISSFDEVTTDQFMKAYDDLNKKDQKGMILDLRNNPGGLLESVVAIADKLVPKGTVLYTEDKDAKRKYYTSNEERINIPLIVLVNGNSASASEVLSGAVKDHKVGELLGTKTYGKGVVQGIFNLSDKTALKITIAKYFTPSGVCIDKIGITPDYVIDLPENLKNKFILEKSEDVQLQKAIELMNGKIR